MTTADLMEHIAVHKKRHDHAMYRAAWMTHHIMSAFIGTKKAPTVDQLLGKTEKVTVGTTTT